MVNEKEGQGLIGHLMSLMRELGIVNIWEKIYLFNEMARLCRFEN